jgi:hypothetical protein
LEKSAERWLILSARLPKGNRVNIPEPGSGY